MGSSNFKLGHWTNLLLLVDQPSNVEWLGSKTRLWIIKPKTSTEVAREIFITITNII